MYPSNESETIEVYQFLAPRLGWKIVHLQTKFPDAVIENERGRRLVAEFEHRAYNFCYHGHDPKRCDLIICWENDWPLGQVLVFSLAEFMMPQILERQTRAIDRWISRTVGDPFPWDTLERLTGEVGRLRTERNWLRAAERDLVAEAEIRGVATVSLYSKLDHDRLWRFLCQIAAIPEVQDIQDVFIRAQDARHAAASIAVIAQAVPPCVSEVLND